MDITQIIDNAFENVGRTMPGFSPREPQITMAHAIREALMSDCGSRIAVVEGQTGTGKTMGYLLSAIPAAQARGKKLIIATATVSLQNQLVNRDLPAVKKYSGLNFRFVIAKGRGRYMCPVLLSELHRKDPNQVSLGLGDDEPAQERVTEKEVKIIKNLYNSFGAESWNGCRDDLKEDVPDDLWRRMTSTTNTCSGKRCPAQRMCPFYLARWGMRDADVIVANHDLVLADLSLDGGGAILPKPSESIYVFDEGHHLSEKAVERAASRGTLSGLAAALRRVPKVIRMNPAGQPPVDISGPMNILSQGVEHLKLMLDSLDFQDAWGNSHLYRAKSGVLPTDLADFFAIMSGHVRAVWKGVDLVQSRLLDEAEHDEHIAISLVPESGKVAEALDRYAELFDLLGQEVDPSNPPIARWIERLPNQDYHLEAVPVTSASWLRKNLWEKAAGAVVTSATLTSLNSWSRFRAKNGLKDGDGTIYLRLKSPFSYRENAELFIPWMETDPAKAAEHTREVIRMMPQLLEHSPNGTLCLFSSWRQLKEVYEGMPASLTDRIICQGDYTRDETLEMHASRIEAGRPSVLFGVASMAEGLDLPGKLCDHVIIAKLPFAPPDSPVDATRAEWLESKGVNPFVAMSIPDASFKLIQSCGRLIRTESDSGRITLLDRRIITKRYGKQLLDSLPPFRQTVEQRSKVA